MVYQRTSRGWETSSRRGVMNGIGRERDQEGLVHTRKRQRLVSGPLVSTTTSPCKGRITGGCNLWRRRKSSRIWEGRFLATWAVLPSSSRHSPSLLSCRRRSNFVERKYRCEGLPALELAIEKGCKRFRGLTVADTLVKCGQLTLYSAAAMSPRS